MGNAKRACAHCDLFRASECGQRGQSSLHLCNRQFKLLDVFGENGAAHLLCFPVSQARDGRCCFFGRQQRGDGFVVLRDVRGVHHGEILLLARRVSLVTGEPQLNGFRIEAQGRTPGCTELDVG